MAQQVQVMDAELDDTTLQSDNRKSQALKVLENNDS
jgi:hypothetical protein